MELSWDRNWLKVQRREAVHIIDRLTKAGMSYQVAP